ncbi:ankyrin repeat domain-containing protein, partial [Wolbachia endosymbiont of Atemnus politus]|nr:ankyrin repeat domain-containing protein [Wolbachia endosymbiont of Atemnus politus]
MSMDLSALATNADKLEECIDKNEKREQEGKEKDKQLRDTIERKVKKEEHRRKKPRSRDGTLKRCKRLFKEGASPDVLAELEESLREQEKYHRYYVQCFLPVLNRKISKELDPIKKEEIGQVISEITGKNNDQNHYNRSNSEDSGVGSDSDDDRKYQTNDTEPKNGEIFSVCADEDINDRLLE